MCVKITLSEPTIRRLDLSVASVSDNDASVAAAQALTAGKRAQSHSYSTNNIQLIILTQSRMWMLQIFPGKKKIIPEVVSIHIVKETIQ